MRTSSNINGGAAKKRFTTSAATSSDSGIFLPPALKSMRRNAQPIKKAMRFQMVISTLITAYVLFQIYFLYQLEKIHKDTKNDPEKIIPRQHGQPKKLLPQGSARIARAGASNGKHLPRPKVPPPPKTSLLPKRVITIFGPESSGTTFLATTLGIAVGAWTPLGKWTYIPGNQWTIPDESHEFIEPARWKMEGVLGRRAQSEDGLLEIQHLSLPWGWFCEENEEIHIVEALVPEECWRYEIDSHVSPETAEKVWYGASTRAKQKLPYYQNPDNFLDVEKIPKRKPQELKYIELCKNELHISQENEDTNDWTCGAKCGSGAYDGFALYPKRFSVNITSHIEWYLSRGVEVTAILSARDRTISSKAKQQDHCRLDMGAEEDQVALGLMTEALEQYGKSGSNGDRERVLVVSYEGLMRLGKAYLFDLYRKLGINSTYIPTFLDGNDKYVMPFKNKSVPQKPSTKPNVDRRDIGEHKKSEKDASKEEKPDTSEEDSDHKPKESEHTGTKEAPLKSNYEPFRPKTNLLPRRVIAVFGAESSGTTWLASVLAVATGAFPKEGRWTQVLSPNPRNSKDPSNPRMKWKFEHSIDARATTEDEELEVQHLSLPWGWMCHPKPELNEMHVVEAFVPAECMRYETLPDLDLRLAEQIWYNQHNQYPQKIQMEDTVEGFDWEEDRLSRKELEDEHLVKCRDEVKISRKNGSCGAKCGWDKYDGFALYPNRYFVNITSHIEWYLSRGVDITVVVSMRDQSISRAAKLREHCPFPGVLEKEEKIALDLINEAINKYGTRGDSDRARVITVSYEAMMEFYEPYLFDLYYQLGIDSEYIPEFLDGNAKYVTDATKAELTKHVKQSGKLTGRHRKAIQKEKRAPPANWKPRPPMEHVLPKRVITVVGPESSGTTLLATTLGVATGAFDAEGEWYETYKYGRKTSLAVAPSELDFKRDAFVELEYKKSLVRRAHSSDDVEIQHLSLPWGWNCDGVTSTDVVEALVPEDCMRYERAPNMDPHFAESYFWSEHVKEQKRRKRKGRTAHQLSLNRWDTYKHQSDNTYFNDEDMVKLKKCRIDARISERESQYSCGAKCGTGSYDGFALYPQRFSINITSHIEWYLSRGVDIIVVVSTRDNTISQNGSHCKDSKIAAMENEVAQNLITEAVEKYGNLGSMVGSMDKERVITFSYETLMELQQPYLFNLYRQLGIKSTYTPELHDGNIKYVVDPIERNQMSRIEHYTMPFDKQAPRPAIIPPHQKQSNEFFLPRRMISVFSLDASEFLSTTIASASGAFPKGGRWDQMNNDMVYKDTIQRSMRSLDGEVRVQHIILPAGNKECDSTATIVDALVPSECALGLHAMNRENLDSYIAEQCRDEVFISKENTRPGAKWTCGAKCGSEEADGYAIYPSRFFVNISSHIEWYTNRGVHVTAVLQTRDHSIAKKSFAEAKSGCLSHAAASEEDNVGLSLMKEAYQKHGAGFYRNNVERRQKGTARVIIASYETLMKFREQYLFQIYQQLGIHSTYIPTFVDENAKYIRTPPHHKKDSLLKNIVQHSSQNVTHTGHR